MNIATSTATAGAVLGAALLLLVQQLGALAFTDTVPTVLELAGAAIVGAVVFGGIGWAADRH